MNSLALRGDEDRAEAKAARAKAAKADPAETAPVDHAANNKPPSGRRHEPAGWPLPRSRYRPAVRLIEHPGMPPERPRLGSLRGMSIYWPKVRNTLDEAGEHPLSWRVVFARGPRDNWRVRGRTSGRKIRAAATLVVSGDSESRRWKLVRSC